MTAAAPPDPHTHRHLIRDGCFNVRDLGGLGRHTPAPSSAPTPSSSSPPTAGPPPTPTAYAPSSTCATTTNKAPTPRPVPTGSPPCASRWRTSRTPPSGSPGSPTGAGAPPLHYRPFLDRFPERVAATAEALAAAPGGVAFHCAAGRDRTGLVSLLLLSLAGATPEEIAADYALSEERMTPVFTAMGRAEEAARQAAAYRAHATSPYAEMLKVARWFDGAAYLAAAGVPGTTVAALQARATVQARG